MTFFNKIKRAVSAVLLLVAGLVAVVLLPYSVSPSAQAQAQSATRVLQVQAAQQSTYARLIFNLPTSTKYSVTQAGGQVRLVVDGQFRLDFSALERNPVRRIGNGRAAFSGQQTIITFDTIANISPRDFRSGQFLVLDIYGGNPSSRVAVSNNSTMNLPPINALPPIDNATTTGTNTTQTGRGSAPSGGGTQQAPTGNGTTPAGSAQTGDEQEDSEQDVAGQPPADAGAQTPVDAGSTGDTGAPTVTDGDAPSTPSNDKTVGTFTEEDGPEPIQEVDPNAINNGDDDIVDDSVVLNDQDVIDIDANMPRSDSTLILSGISDAVVDPAKLVTTEVQEADNGIAVRFKWPIEAALAVFERGGSLWLLFDQPYGFSAKGLVDGGVKFTDRIESVSQRPHQDALVLQLKLKGSHNTVVEREQNDWIVYLKDTPAQPRFPLKPSTSSPAGQGQQIFVAATDIGRKIEFEDPDVGDLLIALPMLKQGNGFATSYSYAAAQLLKSAQGVIVIPETDFVTVERFQDGIAIRSTGNNVLSSTNLTREEGEENETKNGFARLIDFEAWRVGPKWEYRKNKAKLFYELSLRKPDDRNDVRWRIARYYLAHGRAAEALGMLEIMLLQDPLLERNTDFLAVRGVANFKHGRLEGASRDLKARELEAEQDAELWLALVSEAKGEYEEALEYFRLGRDVMGTYDENDRAEIELAVIRAAIEVEDLEQAQRELDLVNGLNLTSDQLSEQLFQRARIAEMQGQYDSAFPQYQSLGDAPQRWLSARARYASVKFGIKNGDLKAEDAIVQLERLRYAWRGDRFEAQLLDDLAGQYFNTKEYEKGLEALQLAVSYYPDIANEKRMLLRQQYVFKQLFLENRADEMTPIAAISLFKKFTHLTPLGSEGDLLVRKLAQRMVSVDLLGRAAQILDYQVRERTEGAPRAAIAATLAKIYIMDQKPELALEILRATREPRLPQDVEAERRHVEARALVERLRYEEAEILLEGDTSNDANVLRADIFWGAQDWPRVATTIRKLLGDGWRRNEALTALQRLNLVRLSIAMTFAEDRAGLIEMRRRYGNSMRGGDFANAFDLLTNDQELTGRELNSIASQIASVEKLQSFMRDYRNEFSGR